MSVSTVQPAVSVSTATGAPGVSAAAAAATAVYEKLVGLRQADLAAAVMGQADPARLAAAGLDRAEVTASLANMTTEQLLAIRRRVDPTYSTVAPDTADYQGSVLLSVLNIREESAIRLATTAVTGFLFRLLREDPLPAAERRWESKKAAAAADEPLAADALVKRAEALLELARNYKTVSDAAAAAEAVIADLDAELVLEELPTPGTPAGQAVQQKMQAIQEHRKNFEKLSHDIAAFRLMAHTEFVSAGELVRGHLRAAARLATVPTAAGTPRWPDLADHVEKSTLLARAAGQLEIPPKAARRLVEGFLRRWLVFNADAHVSAELSDRVRETVRVEVPGVTGPVERVAGQPRLTRRELLAQDGAAEVAPELEAAAARLFESADGGNAALWACSATDTEKAALLALLARPEAAQLALGRAAVGLAPEIAAALENPPPTDLHHRLTFYMRANRGALTAATRVLYPECSRLLDAAIIVHKVLGGKTPAEDLAAARKFRDQHGGSFAAAVNQYTVGRWGWVAAVDRGRVDIAGPNSGLLTEILERHEEDERLGKQLTAQRIRRAKAANIAEAGPDAGGLDQFRAAGGAAEGLSAEERRRLEAAGGDRAAADDLERLAKAREAVERLRRQIDAGSVGPRTLAELADAERELEEARLECETRKDEVRLTIYETNARTGDFARQNAFIPADGQAELAAMERQRRANAAAFMPAAAEFHENLAADKAAASALVSDAVSVKKL